MIIALILFAIWFGLGIYLYIEYKRNSLNVRLIDLRFSFIVAFGIAIGIIDKYL
jgi:hypothetical protein